MRDFYKGFGYLLEGIRLIQAPGLRRFVVMPLLINIVLFAGLIYAAVSGFGQLLDYLLGFLPDWLHWLQYLLWPLFAATVMIILAYTFTLLANLIAAPFNGLLAEAVEKHLQGHSLENTGDWKTLIKDIVPSLLSEVQKILYFLLRAAPLALLFVIPGVNLAAPLLWTLFSGWMLALEYADYPMDNHGLKFRQQRPLIRQRRLLSMGFGLTTLGLTLIPFVNFIAMPAAVAGATAMWVRELKK
ncbi:MAG: sulfate transporter CysZ [Gammaproteobacteria bacterium]|nr:sulfate transporter CysZ [Gammaproteobacteria bacterium]MBU2478485.1 sulfate transporter CysZ [Gammaproteobacteria bacterium]